MKKLLLMLKYRAQHLASQPVNHIIAQTSVTAHRLFV